MWAPRQPGLDPGCLVGGVVIHHQMDIRPCRHLGINPLEEVEELGGAMALVAFADHGAGGDVVPWRI